MIRKSLGSRSGVVLVRISIVAYAISFILPITKDKHHVAFGIEAFFFTMLPAVSEFAAGIPPFLLWLANPLWFLGLRCFYREQFGMSVCLGMSAAILSSLYLTESWLLCGYYIWVGSMYLLLFGAFLQWKFSRAAENTRAAKESS